jgi:TATA-box binding protein (TBP) (component of TFIID and TFIIIB)
MALNQDIDKEWENFISSNYDDDDISSDGEEINEILQQTPEEFISANLSADMDSEAPKSTNIYISTKTKIAYLNTPIDLKLLFWQVPVIPYAKPCNGIVKKQMKFNSSTPEELKFIQDKLQYETYFEEHVITHIDNPSGRIKFKDTRKLTIGISKKDLLSYRCKKKSAFYNCFVLILRTKIADSFKEFHVKVFNTGKLEIPGVQSETAFDMILNQVIQTLQPYVEEKLGYKENTNETVLINSNFNCGFFINREALYEILKFKYNIQSIYDPCSYPGIQCKFYYNPDVGIQNGCQISEENKHLYNDVKEVSFMIFRTGSVLIVGRCDENVLMIIYEFLKIILNNEYKNICQKVSKNGDENTPVVKDKKKKIRRKNITIEIVNP